MELKHILLTTDLSEEALRPFEPVLALARENGARVTVLNVVRDLQAVPHGAALAPAVSAPDTPQRLEAARDDLANQCPSLPDGLELQQEVISHSDPARGVVEWAEAHGVDLIALSTHGRTGFRRLALGSVAEAVLRLSSIPVLSFHRP